ncbi:uncharacterized protein [Oscarella lobularis]|uniref:uncharacterized protein isoform X2 n=1 Tax=Oscarella lobularis TaxID=121494 RepID=UPI00331349BD
MFTLAWPLWAFFLSKLIPAQSLGCSLVCFNGGFSSSDCSHCVCPSGWTGLRCSSTSPCGDVIKASSGYLTSPGFPEDYDINRNCTWTFDSSLSPSVILLRIVYIFLTGSISDSLWITDRTQNLKVTHLYRGDFEDGDVIKVDSSVVIRFSSGSHVSSQRRFVLEYQVFPGIEPVFISTPDDTTMLKGESVSLVCLSVGSPQPIVRWEKDGRNVTLPQGSKNGELRIQSANESTDSGMYDCISENYLGTVRHQFLVEVHVRPRITHEPADALLDVYISRQYVYFRCDAYGIPEPEIHWKKDGNLIQNPSYLSSASRWLRVRVSSDKFGKYSCYANNSAGAVESSPAVLSGKNASGFHIPDRAYVSSSFLVNANSTVAFLFDFCCRAEIQIQKIFRDGNSLSGLKYRGLNTVFSDDQIVTFENATVSDSGVYKFEILVIVDYRDVFETFLFHPIDVKELPRPIMSPSTQIYPFHPGKSLLLVCTERLTNPRSSLSWFLNGVRMNDKGHSHFVYNYDRKSYLNVRNLTKVIVDRNNHNNWRGDFGANFTCQAKTTYSSEAKNISAWISLPSHVGSYGYFWSFWSSSAQCSGGICGRNSGFRLRHRTCFYGNSFRSHCYGGRNSIEACFSERNCSSMAESPTETSRSPEDGLSAGAASGVTFVTMLVVIGAAAFLIVVIFKKKKISFRQSPQAKADKCAASQSSSTSPYSTTPAIAKARIKSNESGQTVSDSSNDAVGGQEMKADPVYEDVENSSLNKKEDIRWTTTSHYDKVESDDARDQQQKKSYTCVVNA